jgi:2-succinyl-5-enolpyruvyl-6-hydroxy-3-cyclohexene-1-carboxylate synthase
MTNPAAPPTSMEAARAAVKTLIEGGVREVILCPGSRSAPLAYALAEAERGGTARVHVRIDERDAGFTALGISLATSRPVAVVTTSGTAVGELLPAVMEAHHAAVPLVVVSADRPEELRGTGANQTTDQVGLFGGHVRWSVDVAAGTDPADDVRRALLAGDGLMFGADSRELHGLGVVAASPALGGQPAVKVQLGARGPVHINLAFRDPLVPEAGDRYPTAAMPVIVPAAGEPATEDSATAGTTPDSGTPSQPSTTGGLAAGAEPEAAVHPEPHALAERRTVVVAGHDATALAERFARQLGLPLLAEPSSNARFGPQAVGPYRLLLPAFEARIDRVVVFGRPTLSRPVARLLAATEHSAAMYVPEPVAWFEAGRRPERVIDDLAELAGFAGRGAPGWLEEWKDAAEQGRRVIDAVLEPLPLTGLGLAREVWATAQGPLVIGSSNAIRDADLMAVPAPSDGRRIYANRGLAGIDGTVATATGIALAFGPERRTTVLLGDVTFLHDVGGLFIGNGEEVPVMDLVVLNDGGGAIFSTLEHGAMAESERYRSIVERFFGTPQHVDLRALAAAYGLDYVRVQDKAALHAALAAGPTRHSRVRRRIVDVGIDRSGIRGLHLDLNDAVSGITAGSDVE